MKNRGARKGVNRVLSEIIEKLKQSVGFRGREMTRYHHLPLPRCNIAVEIKQRKEKKKNGKGRAVTILIFADTESLVDIGGSARHRLTGTFFFAVSHGNILLAMHICRAWYLSLKA